LMSPKTRCVPDLGDKKRESLALITKFHPAFKDPLTTILENVLMERPALPFCRQHWKDDNCCIDSNMLGRMDWPFGSGRPWPPVNPIKSRGRRFITRRVCMGGRTGFPMTSIWTIVMLLWMPFMFRLQRTVIFSNSNFFWLRLKFMPSHFVSIDGENL
jgi:hypothetical protein